ncbi:formylglycine-generating enzyme family protein [bacterium]|nr:formylglycine-generating enzyme family protein [bacterium]
MKRFLNLLVVLLIFLVFSCSSSKSQNDTDIISDSDSDNTEIVNDNTDSEEDSDFIDDSYETPDQDTDQDSDSEKHDSDTDTSDEDYGPLPDNCIEVYPGQPNSRLCLGPKKTDVRCNANPTENKYVTVLESDGSTEAYENSLGNLDDPMDINDDFVFFVLNPKDSATCFDDETYCPNIYGCNRKDEYVYEIVTSKFNHNFFSVDGDKIVFNVWDGLQSDWTKADKLLIADLKNNEIAELTDWGSHGQMQIVYPYVVFIDGVSDNPLILNLEANFTKKISNLKCDDTPKIDGKYLVCDCRYIGEGLSKDELDETAWIVDLETFEVSPLSVFTHEGANPVVSGDYTVFHSGRDTVYYDNYPGKLSGMEIYSLNLKNKREEKWTPEIKGIFEGNFSKPSFEYPYFAYLANETNQASTGASYVLNIETGEVTKFWEKTAQDRPYIKDRYLLLGGYIKNGIAKLPDLPKLPENADELCEDNNPCTDNRYFVTDGECHFIPNHERCDDDDDTTLFDICIDGECKGFAGTSSDEEMVLVKAGTFLYDGKEYEIEKSFKMDVFEVTNGKYAECVEAKACVEPLRKRSLTVLNYYGNPFYDNFPVLYINQFEAQNYCNWLGKRLPTEFEWMKATWDGEEKTYLWGEERPNYETYPDSYYANSAAGYPQMTGWDVVEVGTFPKDKTVGGIMDMSGNVSEWTTSEWTKNLCEVPPCHGKFGSDLVVSKGGEEWFGPELAARYPWTPWTHSFRIGFRCVKDLEETENKIKP